MRWIRPDSATGKAHDPELSPDAAGEGPDRTAPALPGHPPGPPSPPPLGRLPGPEENALERYRAFLLTLLLGTVAVVLVLALGFANYRLGQPPHRLIKALVGLTVAAFFLWRPASALLVLPLSFPFIAWLPKSGLPLLNGMNLLLASLLLGWVVRTVGERRRFFDPSPWNVPLGIFLAWLTFSWLHSVLLEGSGPGAIVRGAPLFWNAIAGLLLFFMVYNNVQTWRQVRRLSLLFCIGSALGLAGLLHESSDLGGARRVAGGLGQQNVAGAFFASGTLFALGMLSAGYRGLLRRGVLVLSVLASAAGTVLPASRGAFVGFLAGGLLQAVRGGVIWILVLGLLVGGFVALAPDYVKERLTETQAAITAGEGERFEAMNEDAGGRLDFWRASLKVIEQDPVIGVGFGRVIIALEPYLQKGRPSHNLYLEVAVENGIPGLLLLLWVLLVPLWMSRVLLRRRGLPRAFGIGYGSALVALLVSNLFGGRLFDFGLGGSLAFVTALMFRTRALVLAGVPEEEEA